MTVTFTKRPAKPVKVSTPNIVRVEQPKQEPKIPNITRVEQPKKKPRVFMGYDAKGRPVFTDKDEPEAKE